LRTSPGEELLAGTIIQGTPYVAVYNNSDGVFYLRAFSANQTVNEMRREDIRAVVAETLAEQHGLHHADIDAVVLKAMATILTSFGIEEEDRRELRADFQHLRRWRKGVEQAQSYTLKAAITIIVTGLFGAVWLGVKAVVGK
jgi:hypothetical protein